MRRDERLALGLGGIVWFLGTVAYGAALLRSKPADATTSLLYNAPIAFLFLILLTHMAIQAARLGVAGFVRTFGPTVAVWMAGGLIVYLRLISKSIEVSGHLAWLPLLTAQLWASRFPAWLVIIGIAATASAAYMKFVMFRGPSGIPGLAAGALLATALVVFRNRSQDGGS